MGTLLKRKFCSKACYKADWAKQETCYHTEYNRRHPKKCIIKGAKSRALKRNIPFSITEDDIVLPKYCPVLGIELMSNIGTGSGGRDNSYSIDRIIPELGYIPGNIQILSHKANSMKFNASPKELVMFAKWVLKNYE